MPHTAYIVEAVRTAGGKKNGALREWHACDLGASVIDDLITRTGIDGANIDDVICGCVDQVGAQSGNIGRMIVLASKKLPESVPGVSVDRQCGSSQQSLHFAAMAVMSGVQDAVIACGVEHMTQVPIGANVIDSYKLGRGLNSEADGIQANYPGAKFSQFMGAELLAKKHNLTREELDKFGYESHQKAVKAIKEGKFTNEVVPLQGKNKQGEVITHKDDEGVRPNVSIESMTKLKPLAKGGKITAATSSQICDGASAILICNERGLKKLGLKPRAKIIDLSLAADSPIVMLEGPLFAAENSLKKSGMKLDQIDLIEINEAFAPVPLAWVKHFSQGDGKSYYSGTQEELMSKLNIYGGAIALGHALGSTGTRIFATLVNALEQENKKYGMVAICEGGGTSNSTIIERVTDYEHPANL